MLDLQNMLISKYPFIEKIPSVFVFPLFSIGKKVIMQNDINCFVEENKQLSPFEFIEEILEYFDFSYKVSHNQIENIPKNGRVVIIANHPLGALDALSLIDLIKNIRTDIKIVANSMLGNIEPLKEIMIEVDPFKNKISKESMKRIYNSLENEEAVIIFPAGEVSRFSSKGISDGKWHKSFLKFAKKTHSPILPVFIKSKNSSLFYTLSLINKNLGAVLLPREMFKQRGKFLEFVIGKMIPYKSFANTHLNNKTEIKLFKKHLYSIAKNKKEVFKTQKPIAHPVNRQDILRELKKCEVIGETSDKKLIFLYLYNKGDFAILKEIGRLREFTFRKVEEGTGKRIDTDKFDKYYKHIILWDKEELEIIGCYRIGDGCEIMEKYGIKGFYTNTLFDFNNNFSDYLRNSVELGRSFIQPKYWGSRALDYLWQGIGKYLAKNGGIKYMFGPVSLSGAMPKNALNLIIAYYRHYYGTSHKLIKAKDPFIINREEQNELEEIFTFRDKKKDFLILKKQLKCFNITVPTLYKQYTELCEENGVKFLDFNIDKDFNNCVDGFIMVDITKMRPDKKERYIDK